MHLADLQPDQREPAATEAARDRSYSWDDPATSAAAARDLDGLAFLQAILDGTVASPPVARTLDFTRARAQDGRALHGLAQAATNGRPLARGGQGVG